MNANAKAWIAELRSGKRVQGTGYLRQKVGGVTEECCLGVACDLAGLSRVDGVHPNRGDIVGFGRDKVTRLMPSEVVEWLGLRPDVLVSARMMCPDAHVEYDIMLPTLRKISSMNDSGSSFEDIADALEADADFIFED